MNYFRLYVLAISLALIYPPNSIAGSLGSRLPEHTRQIPELSDWPELPACRPYLLAQSLKAHFKSLQSVFGIRPELCAMDGPGAQASWPSRIALGTDFSGLPACQAAFVLAHEFAHLALGHEPETLAAAAVLAKLPSLSASGALAAMDFDLGISLRLSDLSQKQEFEADSAALYAASLAGCSPEDGALAWLADQNLSGQPVMRTHPSIFARIQRIQSQAKPWDSPRP